VKPLLAALRHLGLLCVYLDHPGQEHLMVLIVLQNLVGIDCVVLKI